MDGIEETKSLLKKSYTRENGSVKFYIVCGRVLKKIIGVGKI